MTVRALAAATALGLALALSACAVGPRYHPPPLPGGADSPLVSVRPRSEVRTHPPDAWWRLYRDPRLDSLIEAALRANFDLRAADANLGAAQAILDQARAARYPATRVTAGAVRGRDANVDLILELQGRKPKSIWLYDALFDLSYEVDLFGRVHRLVQAARANAGAAQAARDTLRVAIAAETTRAYGEVCALGEQIDVARRNLDLAESEAAMIASRRAAGASSDFDVVRAQALVEQVRSRIPPLQGARRAALFELTALIGRTPTEAPRQALSCHRVPKLLAPLPVGDGAALLRRRPDVRAAERQLAAATARIGIATADLFPRVELGGSFGSIADQVNLLGTSSGLTWGIGPTIRWQFPNLAGPLAEVHRAKWNAAASLDEFDAVVLRALEETEQSLSIYGAALDEQRDLDALQAKARRAFDLARQRFAAGAISHLDLLTAEQTLVAADAQVAASDAAVIQDQVSVFKALGGGWDHLR